MLMQVHILCYQPSYYNTFQISVTSNLVKVKAIPLQPWRGPEGSRRFRLPEFKTISI
jgi:hypothetical protein